MSAVVEQSVTFDSLRTHLHQVYGIWFCWPFAVILVHLFLKHLLRWSCRVTVIGKNLIREFVINHQLTSLSSLRCFGYGVAENG